MTATTIVPGPLALWRDRQFVYLATARMVSVLGNGFARVALGFAVLDLPGAGPGRLSSVLACQALPQLLFVLAGGVIADRMSRTRLMALADMIGAAAYAGLATMTLTRHAPVVLFCLLAVAAGTATALFSPAMDGVVPLVVPPERLQQANGLLRVGTNSSLLLGLALSGVTVAAVGAGWALALNAASFVISAALTWRLKALGRPRRAGSGWTDLREGWREFSSRQWLWAVVAQYTVVVAALNANAGVLGPLTAQQHYGGAGAWSVIVAAQALGTLAGAGLATRLRPRRPILVAVLTTLPSALPIALLGLRAPVWVTAGTMFCSGVSSDVFAVLWSTTIQREVPEHALSRVSSYDWFGSLAFAPIGLLAAGPAATAYGTSTVLDACAILIALATGAALLSPQVRTLRTPNPDPEPAPAHVPAHDTPGLPPGPGPWTNEMPRRRNITRSPSTLEPPRRRTSASPGATTPARLTDKSREAPFHPRIQPSDRWTSKGFSSPQASAPKPPSEG